VNSIFKKGLLLIAAPLLFQGIFLAVLLHNERQSVEAERWALHSKQVIGQAENCLRTLYAESNRTRGLVLTGDSVFSPQVGSLDAQIAALRRSVADNPLQARRVEDFGAAAARLERWFGDLAGLVRSGRSGEAVSRIRDLSGERLLADVQAKAATFLDEEQRLDRLRTEALADARRRQDWLLLGAAAAAVATALFTVGLFAKNVSSRLEVVTANARRLAENAPPAAPVGGNDEIAELDRTLHATAFRLAGAAAAEGSFREELERRAAELARVNEDLRDKTQEIETFVYSVSHDLRSPLVNLQGFSRELQRSCADLRKILGQAELQPAARREVDLIDDEMAESVRFIQTAVSRSASIIDALLRLSRAGRVEYQWQPVDVAGVVRRVVDAMRSSIEEKKVQVTVGDLPPAWGDPTAVEQIFGNLVSNAVNYLDPARPGEIAIGGRNGSNGAGVSPTYWVKDNGLGIPEAYRAKLFKAFQRLHGDVAPGEGIGLALVRRVVERHGGEIRVESEEGKGTTFLLTLPAPERPAEAGAERPEHPA
jgi:signal transduction histidine kinase